MSVYELDCKRLSNPQGAREVIAELWAVDDGVTAFEVAKGLYWHCSDWHEGQGSARYSILSQLDYKPCASERGCEGDPDAQHVYDLLESQAKGEKR